METFARRVIHPCGYLGPVASFGGSQTYVAQIWVEKGKPKVVRTLKPAPKEPPEPEIRRPRRIVEHPESRHHRPEVDEFDRKEWLDDGSIRSRLADKEFIRRQKSYGLTMAKHGSHPPIFSDFFDKFIPHRRANRLAGKGYSHCQAKPKNKKWWRDT